MLRVGAGVKRATLPFCNVGNAKLTSVNQGAVACIHTARPISVKEKAHAVGMIDDILPEKPLSLAPVFCLIAAGQDEVKLDLGMLFPRREHTKRGKHIKAKCAACAKFIKALANQIFNGFIKSLYQRKPPVCGKGTVTRKATNLYSNSSFLFSFSIA